MLLRCTALLALSVGLSSGTVIEYSDYNTWSTAELSQPGVFLITENFSGNQINTPGLSLVSTQGPGLPGNGHIVNGEWMDNIQRQQNGGTRINYANGQIFGLFFQNWQDSNPGLTLWGANAQDHPEMITPPLSGAWGFVSTGPISSLFFSDDVGSAYFSFGPLTIADPTPAPEPQSIVLILLGGLGLYFTKKPGTAIF